MMVWGIALMSQFIAVMMLSVIQQDQLKPVGME